MTRAQRIKIGEAFEAVNAATTGVHIDGAYPSMALPGLQGQIKRLTQEKNDLQAALRALLADPCVITREHARKVSDRIKLEGD